MVRSSSFDVLVIGGGHAGVEAALAASRMGCRTAMLTHSLETIGQMSCNPAIGGIGKSHLVREIDALDGAMARAADQAGIHFRVLNAGKGPAVRATRAQTDRALYRAAIQRMAHEAPNLRLFQGTVDDLLVRGETVHGVRMSGGIRLAARAVVLCAGTFLGGVIYVGEQRQSGGRAGAPAVVALAHRLRELPLRVGRLKTGTPPRLDARTVRFEGLSEQPGDTPRPVMSFLGSAEEHPPQRSCYITHTSERTHEIIRANLHRSPMYSGRIEGRGPRYCPSIEDKVVRFADRSSHQVFIEPEGLESTELYPNGISTSLPFDVQQQMVHSIPGFEDAHIVRPGYAIEYDYFDPRDLRPDLSVRFLKGLYFAGQINGTTGYEEAGAQGLLAGCNAALYVRGQSPWQPRRDEAYLGVLVDDLNTRGVTEPYRMFTSRAEYRLLLREDNADWRLTEQGRRLGLVTERRWRLFCEKRQAVERERKRLSKTLIRPGSEAAVRLEKYLPRPLAQEAHLDELLRRPELQYRHLREIDADCTARGQVAAQVEAQIKYAGYIRRQEQEINAMRNRENTRLPERLQYGEVRGLSHEVRQKLTDIRPQTLGQASRIEGVTPAALSLLLIHLRKQSGEREAKRQ